MTWWISWTLLYALAIWGVSAISTLLEPWLASRGLSDIAHWGNFLIPLVLALLIGAWLRSWWWIAGPPIAIVFTTLSYATYAYLSAPQSQRSEVGTGFVLAVIATVMNASIAAVAAAVGVWLASDGLA